MVSTEFDRNAVRSPEKGSMFARVAMLEGRPEQLEAGIRDYREHVVPEARKLAGFKGAYLLVDRKTGKNISITLWETEKAERDSAEAANKLRANASQIVSASKPPVVGAYEIAVQG